MISTNVNRVIYLIIFFFASLFSLNAENIEAGTYTVNVSSSLTLRNAPNLHSTKIGSLVNGEVIYVENIKNGWAQVNYHSQIGYVKADYIVKNIVNKTESEIHYNRSFNHFLYYIMPYVGLGIFILLILFIRFDVDNAIMVTLFILGAIEFLFAIGCSVKEGVNPWFCEHRDVGWIWTIINYLLLIGVLSVQYNYYKGYISNLRIGCLGNIFFTILVFFIGVAIITLFKLPKFWFLAPIAIGIMFFVFYLKTNYFKKALLSTLYISITFGGFFMFFLQMLGVLLLGGLIIILIMAFLKAPPSTAPPTHITDINAPDGTHHVNTTHSRESGFDENGNKWNRIPGTNKWEKEY